MGVLEVSRRVRAAKETAWRIVSDVEQYARYAPNLGSSHITAGSGVGMVRSCTNLSGRPWREECTLWEEGERYAFRVDTSDYPYPVSRVQGAWSVEDAPGGAALVKMRFEYTMKYGVIGSLIGLAMRPWMLRTCKRLLDNWQADIEALDSSSNTAKWQAD